jgi:hypothetical protein
VILRVYAKESKRITFSHKITSLKESAFIKNQNQMELYQIIGPYPTVRLKGHGGLTGGGRDGGQLELPGYHRCTAKAALDSTGFLEQLQPSCMLRSQLGQKNFPKILAKFHDIYLFWPRAKFAPISIQQPKPTLLLTLTPQICNRQPRV